jgi:O-antigen/teichoic acid export membrane protein
MSTIRKQSIIGSIIAVVGVVVGFLNSGWLQPKILEVEQIGILRYILSLSALVSVFSGMGVGAILLRYIPLAQKNGYQKQLSAIFAIILFLGQILGLFGLAVYLNFWQEKLGAQWYVHVYLLYSVGFMFSSLAAFLSAKSLVSHTLFVREICVKLGFVLSLVAVYLFHFSFEAFLSFVEISYVLSVGLILFFLFKFKKIVVPSFDFSSSQIPLKAIGGLALFSVMSGSVGVFTKEIDILMVTRLIDFEATGIYSIMLFFGVLVSIPSRGLQGISSVKIGEAWADNNVSFLNDLYRKTAQNQLIVAGFVFVMLIGNLFTIFDILPKGDVFSKGLWVVFWLGLAQLIDMASGVSGELLYYSKHYKYGFYFSTLLLVSLVGFNFLFIPMYGISGAAFATFLSQVLNNFARWFYLRKFYNLQPFNSHYLRLFLFTVLMILYALVVRGYLVDLHFVVAGIVMCVPIVVLYFLLVRQTNLAPDLKERIKVYEQKLGFGKVK